jgi:hypothetical protein
MPVVPLLKGLRARGESPSAVRISRIAESSAGGAKKL